MSDHKKGPFSAMDRRSFLQFTAAATGTAALGLKTQE
ncbi:MAG: twin-arginine translocation signal domain-containing protein, partial [Alcaligenaceae bacterium]|nr:twin-arginine translocation signal domain-containing protein [Alcaligenaceae bacterium]